MAAPYPIKKLEHVHQEVRVVKTVQLVRGVDQDANLSVVRGHPEHDVPDRVRAVSEQVPPTPRRPRRPRFGHRRFFFAPPKKPY